LCYLPHSGFHNQRIALENALVLARLLNWVLLVPPIRFGRRAIPYRNLTVLRHALDANYTAYLRQISENTTNQSNTAVAQEALLDFSTLPERRALGKERKPVTYTYLPWGWITDFDFIRYLQPTIQIFGSPHFRLSQLGLHANDVLVIPDTSKYQYRFTDEIMLDPSLDQRTLTNATYSEDITLSSLIDHPAKLIQLGSLFGSRRLELSDPMHKAIRKRIRRCRHGPVTPPATQAICRHSRPDLRSWFWVWFPRCVLAMQRRLLSGNCGGTFQDALMETSSWDPWTVARAHTPTGAWLLHHEKQFVVPPTRAIHRAV